MLHLKHVFSIILNKIDEYNLKWSVNISSCQQQSMYVVLNVMFLIYANCAKCNGDDIMQESVLT